MVGDDGEPRIDSMPLKLSVFSARSRKIIKQFLNHPDRRWLLGLAYSLQISIKTRRVVKVRFDDGVWVQKDKFGMVVDWNPSHTYSLPNFESVTIDYYCYAYKPKSGDVVIDIGAGIGAETYYFSKIVGPQGRVISIEAQPQTYLCLNKFCQYNKLDNVVLLNAAVSDVQSQVLIGTGENHISNSIMNSISGVMVDAVPLDSIVEKYALTEIDFIKMNIEGAEKLAILGMSKTLAMTRSVCICCHDFKADRDGDESLRTRAVVSEFLIKNGFEITSRSDDERPWVRDHLFGTNLNLPPRSASVFSERA